MTISGSPYSTGAAFWTMMRVTRPLRGERMAFITFMA